MQGCKEHVFYLTGHACPKGGMESPEECKSGQFCIAGVKVFPQSAVMTVAEALAAAAGAPGAAESGGSGCPTGMYCPAGSRFALPCPPGMYCAISRLQRPQGACAAGYVCNNLATINTPQPGNNLCPSQAEGGSCSTGVTDTPNSYNAGRLPSLMPLVVICYLKAPHRSSLIGECFFYSDRRSLLPRWYIC